MAREPLSVGTSVPSVASVCGTAVFSAIPVSLNLWHCSVPVPASAARSVALQCPVSALRADLEHLSPVQAALCATWMKEQNAVLAAAGACMAGTPVRTSTAALPATCSPSVARLPASSPDRAAAAGPTRHHLHVRQERGAQVQGEPAHAGQPAALQRRDQEVRRHNVKQAAKLLEAVKSVSASDEQYIANVEIRTRPSSRTPSRAISP